MSIINPQTKEINCKVVYYGPALAGKTTSLKALQNLLKKKGKNGLIKKVPETGRTLFFDFLALSSAKKVQGYKTKFQVYTVPGQVLYEDSRKLLLNGVDGIIFVADSRLEYVEETLRSFNELKLNLGKLGYDPSDIPTIIQYNKRDATTAIDVNEFSKILNPDNLPEFESVAVKGEGVLEPFEAVLSSVLLDMKEAA